MKNASGSLSLSPSVCLPLSGGVFRPGAPDEKFCLNMRGSAASSLGLAHTHRVCARSCCSLWRTLVCNYSARLPKCFLKRAFRERYPSPHSRPPRPNTPCAPTFSARLFRRTFIDVMFAESLITVIVRRFLTLERLKHRSTLKGPCLANAVENVAISFWWTSLR